MTMLPTTGAPWGEVATRMDQMAQGDVKWRDGKAAVYVFNAGPEIEQVQKEAYAKFSSENGLGLLCCAPPTSVVRGGALRYRNTRLTT